MNISKLTNLTTGNAPEIKNQNTGFYQPAFHSGNGSKPELVKNGRDLLHKNDTWLSMIYNLLLSLDESANVLEYALKHKDWLNAFLLSSGMVQILEDALHPDPLYLSRIAAFLYENKGQPGAMAARPAIAASQLLVSLHQQRKSMREAHLLARRLRSFANELAAIVIGAESPDPEIREVAICFGQAIRKSVGRLPASLRKDVVRIPSCFRSFDQQPGDLKKITKAFSDRYPDRSQAIIIVGIRTSGSYLAPLYAALLKSNGYTNVNMITVRPQRAMTFGEWAHLRRLICNGAIALICDDPPISGASLLRTALQLERGGLPAQNIILLLQLFGEAEELPKSLQKYASILMPWKDWAVHHHLALEAVKEVLSGVWGPGFQVADICALTPPGNNMRQHIQAVYSVTLKSRNGDRPVKKTVLVRGVGLGYFGEHAVAIAHRLKEYTLPTLCLRDGLLYQEILPPTQIASGMDLAEGNDLIQGMAGYILERSLRLPVPEDIALRLTDRKAAWEVAANQLANSFGWGRLIARHLFIDSFVKNILSTPRPSVIDGSMDLDNWIREGSSFVKLNPDDRDFSHLDLFSFDPVFDLASLAEEFNQENVSSMLKEAYESRSGEKISNERWMLYRLVHLWDLQRENQSAYLEIKRQMARAVQSYYSDIYFQDLEIPTAGPVCAIDIDGVLETNLMGFPTLTPAGAISLRALNLHGFRAIINSGRSLPEVIDRCQAYHLPGGVAEYGAALYDHHTGETISLLTHSEAGALQRLRSTLSDSSKVILDTGYIHSVRALRFEHGGLTRGLDDRAITRMLDAAGVTGKIAIMPGKNQTDFTVSRLDKGSGLDAWLERLGDGSQCYAGLPDNSSTCAPATDGRAHLPEKPVAMAMGDSAADLPMLAQAKLAFAPANASLTVKRSGVQVTSRPYQRGFAQAVTKLLGHPPGSCSVCRDGDGSSDSARMIQSIFAIQEYDQPGRVWQALKSTIQRMK